MTQLEPQVVHCVRCAEYPLPAPRRPDGAWPGMGWVYAVAYASAMPHGSHVVAVHLVGSTQGIHCYIGLPRSHRGPVVYHIPAATGLRMVQVARKLGWEPQVAKVLIQRVARGLQRLPPGTDIHGWLRVTYPQRYT